MYRAIARCSSPRFESPRDRRHAWAYLFGAVCPERAVGAALVLPYADAAATGLHLAEIGRHVTPGAHGVVVLDGAGWHAAGDLAVPGNLTLLPLPRYSPELNPVENVWEYLRQNKLIPTALIGDRFRPLAASDRGEPVGRRRRPVSGVAAGRDDRLVVRPDPQAELVLPQVLPHVLDRVQTLWGGRRG